MLRYLPCLVEGKTNKDNNNTSCISRSLYPSNHLPNYSHSLHHLPAAISYKTFQFTSQAQESTNFICVTASHDCLSLSISLSLFSAPEQLELANAGTLQEATGVTAGFIAVPFV